ncbi:protein kinase domain-containing protein [Microbacterium sp. SLBN-146]|uniref:protein kinase domain-containing protein n=1 Tax=Microbacterium sp. SLBN-146 TaxID=2768457 RepID=UPI00117116A6|nr:protein kinase [Microbacterium sp. SLBN-146]TQJ31350.1 serine/threonine-protein kinase [Microbacterium sp. SLBN-146]
MIDDVPPQDPPIGLIADRFRVAGLLGTGGSASVFRAFDSTENRAVAIKLLHPHLSDDAGIRAAFLAEARRSRELRHPRIVEVIDVGVFHDDGSVIAWIAEELIAGATLAEHVRAHGPLSTRHAVELGRGILDALSAAHDAGLVHRDVSPTNVMLEFDGDTLVDVTLLDFGLADVTGADAVGSDVLRSRSHAGRTGVVGNVHFASPEQLRGEPIDGRGDLYQLGAVLFFAVTGRRPYDSPDRTAVMRAHLSSPPPVPSVRAPGVPGAFDRVVVRAMLKSPEDRFQDAAEMRAALDTVIVASGSVDATTVTRVWGPPQSGQRPAQTGVSATTDAEPVRPRESIAWGVGLAAAALLTAVVIAVPLLIPAESAAPRPVSSTPAASVPAPSPSTPVPNAPAVAQTVVVPSLGALGEFLTALHAGGLVAGDIRYVDSPADPDTVIDAMPAPGEQVAAGTVVALTVASGANVVPAVAGLTPVQALEVVRSAGFDAQLAIVTSSDLPRDVVIGTDPATGSHRLGSTVRIVVSAGPVQPTPKPTPTPEPTPEPTSTVPGNPPDGE